MEIFEIADWDLKQADCIILIIYIQVVIMVEVAG